MEFDIIPLTQTMLNSYTVVQMKLLRTAQQKKNELTHKMEKELDSYREVLLTRGMHNSSLIEAKEAELQKELKYQVAILAENLQYNLNLNEPTSVSELGGSTGDEGAGYVVDYSLPYNDRFIIVRDYYLSITDPDERMSMYTADDTARKYLQSYYSYLYDVLYTYSI